MARVARRTSSQRLHEAAWPDMFANLQTAYADLTRTQFELERRASEIEEARDLLQLVIESMSEALFHLDRSGRIVRTNAAARSLLERSESELVDRPFAEVMDISAIPATAWQFLQRAPGGSLRNLEVVLHTHAGRRIDVNASCSLVRDKRGRILGMLVVARDITERKRAEEALAQQAQDLARSNAELEQFAYVASHDLQEPLRMIASYTQLLSRRYQGRIDTDADEFIGYVVDGARRMQRLINDLLSYSRVGTRGKPFGPTNCMLILQTVCSNLGPAIEECGAQVLLERLPVVFSDETQLVQLFQNLIGNAIKFRAPGRPIRVEIGSELRGDEWLFWVRDNGIGIEPQYAERIFMIFQRLHQRSAYPGTGIGLAICKKIIERHGGRIWVEAELDQGSCFYFTLPAYRSADV